jgi:hypothetical protein
MRGDAPRVPKLRPIDYVFLVGAPIVFFVFTFYGLARIVGPIPKPSPVQRIKDGEIKPGTSLDDALKRLGKPKSVITQSDGSMTVTYTRTVADGDLQLEEGVITLDATSHVIESHVDVQPSARPSPSTTQAVN